MMKNTMDYRVLPHLMREGREGERGETNEKRDDKAWIEPRASETRAFIHVKSAMVSIHALS